MTANEPGASEGEARPAVSADVAAFWDAFATATGETAPYTAWGFGDDEKPELMTKLGLLVRDGPKRATTSRVDDYGPGDPMPRVGDYSVILDGDGRPLCIIRVAALEVRPFGAVDAAFAWDEGEGDRSLGYWRAGHLWYFDSVGKPVDDDTPMLLEWFAKVWPPDDDPRTDGRRSG